MEQATTAIDTASQPPGSNTLAVFERADFARMLAALVQRGYQVVRPTVGDGAIIFDEIGSDADLPIGWTDERDGGKYRLKRRGDAALFGYAVWPHSWKKFLFPPNVWLWSARRQNGTSGCVGCGRFIAWCPVAIDITEELS